jgi:DNA-binding MarR family transcriptional regulator
MESKDCGILLKQINDHIAQQANHGLKENGLTLSQLRYLEYLAGKKEGPVPFKEIEHHFQVSQPTVAGILARLSKKGLIVTALVPGSKAKTAALTEKGKKELKKAVSYRNGTEEQLLAPLSPAERNTFRTLLDKIARHMD